MEIKNGACSRLGNMLHLETQKGKEDMETSIVQKHIGGTSAFEDILIMGTKGCGQLPSNDTYFDDSCFSGVKTADGEIYEGVDYCGPVKTSHKGFCIATL